MRPGQRHYHLLGRQRRVGHVERLSAACSAIALVVAVAACGGGEEPRTPKASATLAPPRPTATAAPSAPPKSVGRPRPILSVADKASFAALEARLGGRIGLAVSGLGFVQRVQRLGAVDRVIAWSTSKVPVAMAVYAAGLGTERQADLRAAITASDNAAAERLWAALGGGTRAAAAADAQLRAAGDTQTAIQSERLRSEFTPFGQTEWALADQARFTAGMTCVRAGAQVQGLMGQTVAAQRWGLGADRGVRAAQGWVGPRKPARTGRRLARSSDGRRHDPRQASRRCHRKPTSRWLARERCRRPHGNRAVAGRARRRARSSLHARVRLGAYCDCGALSVTWVISTRPSSGGSFVIHTR